MPKRHSYAHWWVRRVIFAALFTALGVGGVLAGRFVLFEVPLVAFQAVCRADTVENHSVDDLRRLTGPLTQAFFNALHMDFAEQGNYAPKYAFSQGKIYVTWAFHTSWSGSYGKFDEPEETAYWWSQSVVRELFERGREQGSISDEQLWQVMRRHELMDPRDGRGTYVHPEACGLMEEIVIVGGRFASEG